MKEQTNPIYIRQGNFAKKFSFLNLCVVAALLILITLIGFRFLRSPQSGRVQWELRDTASGQLQESGTRVLQPKDIERKPLTADSVVQTIHLNKELTLDEGTVPNADKSAVMLIMTNIFLHSPAMGFAGFKVVDGQAAKQPHGNGQVKYQAQKINGIWQLTRLEYDSDVEYPIKMLSLTDHSQKWTLTIFKGSYINYDDALPH